VGFIAYENVSHNLIVVVLRESSLVEHFALFIELLFSRDITKDASKSMHLY